MVHLCKCNNCNSILIDENPQVDAPLYDLKDYPQAMEMRNGRIFNRRNTMTELEKQIAVARLYGYDIDGETATYQDMDASISGSCHVSELDMCDVAKLRQVLEIWMDEGVISAWKHHRRVVVIRLTSGKKAIGRGPTALDRLFNALAEASKYILES